VALGEHKNATVKRCHLTAYSPVFELHQQFGVFHVVFGCRLVVLAGISWF
jgi:hypothetical protein